MKVLPGEVFYWWNQYVDLVSGIGRLSHLLEMLDAMASMPPPIRLKKVAEAVGIDLKTAWRYMRWLKNRITIRAKYSHSALGLGIATYLVKSRRTDYPRFHWLASITETGEGTLLSYRFPRTEGHEFITESVFRWADKVIWYSVYEEKLNPSPKLAVYWRNIKEGFANPADALRVAVESHPPATPVAWIVRDKPRDLFDLFILAILEKDATLNYTEIAMYLRKKKVYYPKKKVNVHVRHLVDDGVLRGTKHLSVTPSPDILNFVVRFGDWGTMKGVLEAFLKYLYTLSVLANRRRGEAVITVSAPLAYAPLYVRFLEGAGAEVIRNIHFSVANITVAYTIPFRNFDPFTGRWSKNPAQIDEWLKQKGYTVATGLDRSSQKR